MTVIAGVSLFNGVMLLSDCRITLQRRGKPDVHSDIAQKLFPLTKDTAIGFSGDVATAALLLGVLRCQLPKREHKDIASLLQWLPRLFQSSVATLQAKKKRVAQVDFMLAGIVSDHANVVERAKVVELMNAIGFGKGSIQRSFVPDVVMQVVMTPSGQLVCPVPRGKAESLAAGPSDTLPLAGQSMARRVTCDHRLTSLYRACRPHPSFLHPT
jgi:hypothetical protein